MSVEIVPTLPANARGVQIVEQMGGLYSLYTETGPWTRLEEETLLGKDLTESQVVDMVDSFNLPAAEPVRRKEKKEEKREEIS